MARQRMIHPEMWDSTDFYNLSQNGKLLWVCLIQFADDEGYIKPDLNYLSRKFLRTITEDSLNELREQLGTMSKQGMIEIKNEVIKLVNWLSYQKVRFPTQSFLKEVFSTPLQQDYGKDTVTLPKDYGSPSDSKVVRQLDKLDGFAGSSVETEPLKTPKQAKTTNPNVKIALDYYHDVYLKLFDKNPIIHGGKHGVIIKRLLTACNNDIVFFKRQTDVYLNSKSDNETPFNLKSYFDNHSIEGLEKCWGFLVEQLKEFNQATSFVEG